MSWKSLDAWTLEELAYVAKRLRAFGPEDYIEFIPDAMDELLRRAGFTDFAGVPTPRPRAEFKPN